MQLHELIDWIPSDLSDLSDNKTGHVILSSEYSNQRTRLLRPQRLFWKLEQKKKKLKNWPKARHRKSREVKPPARGDHGKKRRTVDTQSKAKGTRRAIKSTNLENDFFNNFFKKILFLVSKNVK